MAAYVEFISRRPGVPLEAFHAIAGPGQVNWGKRYGEDQLILNVGRTWRIGPEPEYLCIWNTPGRSLDRLGGWADVFATGEADDLEKSFEAAGRIDAAGMYDVLREPVPATGPLHYVEFFDTADPAAALAAYETRLARNGLILNALLDRIGMLGPDPRGIAVWQAPSFDAIEACAREAPGQGVEVVRAGLYAPIGDEIL